MSAAVPIAVLNQDLAALAQVICRFRYRFTSETGLQHAVETVLANAAIPFVREFQIDALNRLDFWVHDRFAVELKCAGTLSQALRQAHRYAGLTSVEGVLLLSTEPWATCGHCDTAHGKPVRLARIERQYL